MFFGAVAQSIPDIDFISSFWNGTAENLLAHRGFTHSILFTVLATWLFALFMNRFYKQGGIILRTWMLLFGINIFVHLLIDSLNAYGTGWFEPFSHKRVSFHTLFVVDPLFTIWPFIGFTLLLFSIKDQVKRNLISTMSIGLCFFYIIYAIINKVSIEADVKLNLSQQSIQYRRYLTTPTPLNSLLWYIIIDDSLGFYIGYRSVLDTKENIDLQYFSKNDSLLNSVHDHEEIEHLRRFSQGYYTVEKCTDTLVFNDLRFGQMVGWHDSKEKFVFHYYLQHPLENDLVVQRGRFAKWNRETVYSLVKRIKGN